MVFGECGTEAEWPFSSWQHRSSLRFAGQSNAAWMKLIFSCFWPGASSQSHSISLIEREDPLLGGFPTLFHSTRRARRCFDSVTHPVQPTVCEPSNAVQSQ